jgi:hypothetical protein
MKDNEHVDQQLFSDININQDIGFTQQITPRRKYSFSSLIKKKIANDSRESLFRATMVE